jgi:uncharacterized protein (DUF885 family)
MSVATDPEVVQRFFERLMELRPVEATYHGLREHDRRLPEAGLADVREQQALLGRFESELAGAGEGLDLDLARYYVALSRFQMDEVRLWARMPEAPDQVATGIFLPFARDAAPLDERLDVVTARLEAVPAYLEASREQLTEPVKLWCELALATARELPELFATVVEAAGESAQRARVEAAAAGAGQAVDDFARWLEREVIPTAGDDWALGEERFHQLIELRELPDGPDRILALGQRCLEELKQERAELLASCWPDRTAGEVVELVRSQHPVSFEAALAEYGEVIASAREFVVSRGLATLPENEELRVEPTPGFMREAIPFAAYEPPARFAEHQLGIYVVTPRDGDLSEHNRAAVLNTSVHEGYPGHHLQFSCANQHPSIARLLAAECAHELVEGWAHYGEQLMYEHGFTTSPEVRFVQLNDLLWRACRVIVDIELASGRMGLAEAARLLVEEAGLRLADAEAEVRRCTYTPGYQLSYLYGKHLLLELRQRRRRLEGPAFDLRAFHDRLLYSGALPAATWDLLFS